MLSERLARALGLLAGLLAAVALVAANVVPRGGHALGLDLTVMVASTGEITVDPAGRLVNASGMRPVPGRDRAAGTVRLTNLTGTPLEVLPRATAQLADLDGTLEVRVASGSSTVFAGRLGGLAAPERGILLAPGESRPMTFTAALPPGSDRASEGRVLRVDLDLVSRPVPAAAGVAG